MNAWDPPDNPLVLEILVALVGTIHFGPTRHPP